MGALPNTLASQSPKKPAGRARTNRYGRDPNSPSERLRVSDPDTLAPFVPFPVSFLADIPRLTSGNSCTVILWVLWAKSAGRGAEKGKARPEWTPALDKTDLAQVCHCDERTVERELKALHERGLCEVLGTGKIHPDTKRALAKGEVSARLLYREWEKLPDYKSNVVELPAVPDEPEAADDAPEEKREGFQRLTGKKPLTVKAGQRSKDLPVNVGVKLARFQVEGSVDIEFSAVITKGEQVVRASVPESVLEALKKQFSTSSVSNGLDDGARHGRRGESGESPTEFKMTPRAEKLCDIFNPILAKSRQPSLQSNLSALQAACDALGEFPINDLIEFLGKGRAHRPISSPRVVSLVIGDAKRDATAMAKLPADERPVTREEIDRLIEAERAAKRAKK